MMTFLIPLILACFNPQHGGKEKYMVADIIALDSLNPNQPIKVIKFIELKNYIRSASNAKVKVINFWATWCGPCVKELPFIDSVRYSFSNDEVEVLLVSLDFKDQERKVNAFKKNKGISSPVWLLDESDPNLFIDEVDPSWSGAIPATLFLSSDGSKKVFHEGELNKKQLEDAIHKLLKK